MPREDMVVTSKQCRKCRWSTAYHNWSPAGFPKIPDTFYCMNDSVTEVHPICPAFSEPIVEEEEEGV